MGRTCKAPQCGISGQTLYRFPTKMTDERRGQILRALGFSHDYVPPKNFDLCSAHFTPESIEHRGKISVLKSDCVVFSGAQNFIPSADVEALREEISVINTDRIVSLKQLMEEGGSRLNVDGWTVSHDENAVLFYKVAMAPDYTAKVSRCVSVRSLNRNPLMFRAVIMGKPIKIGDGDNKLQTWAQLQSIIDYLNATEITSEPDCSMMIHDCIDLLETVTGAESQLIEEGEKKSKVESVLSFVLGQLKNIFLGRPHYDTDTVMFSFLFRNISPAAYAYASEFLYLPTKAFLNIKAQQLDTKDNVRYLKDIFDRLKPIERIISIAVDEIYLGQKVEYRNGHISGFAETPLEASVSTPAAVARTAQGFLMQSVCGPMKEILRLMPVAKQTAGELKDALLEVIKTVQDVGFEVVAVITDGNRLNQSMFSMLTSVPASVHMQSFSNPCHPEKLIFVMFDSVHLYKNLRNNWLNTKDADKTLAYPPFRRELEESEPMHQAKFAEIRRLFRSHVGQILKEDHQLSYQVCFPTPFDRQKVHLVAKLFHTSTIAAMRVANCSETANWMQLVNNFFVCFNVKSYGLASRKRLDFNGPSNRKPQEIAYPLDSQPL